MKDIKRNVSQCFLFFENSIGKFSSFLSKNYKHCVLLVHHPKTYSLGVYGLNVDGIKAQISVIDDFKKYIDKIPIHLPELKSYILIRVDGTRPAIKQTLFMFYTCNEIIRLISGINIGFTITPKHLYNKIICNKTPNYTIIDTWHRN